MNLVSLLILPSIIAVGSVESLDTTDIGEAVLAVSRFQPTGLSYVIAGVSLAVLIGAIAFSKRRAGTIDVPDTPATVTPADEAPDAQTPEVPGGPDREAVAR